MTTEATPGNVPLSDLLGHVPERAAFERWATENSFCVHRDDSDKHREYHRATTRWAWMAWQAARAAERERCQPNGLMFDALGEPRTRYVRVTLDGSHMILRPQDGDRYVQEARDSGDESGYVVADVYLSEREFDDLPEFDGF
jgi:hypothetical protein